MRKMVLALTAAVPLAALAAASSLPSLPYAAGSRLWVEGTSTVRGYSCAAGRIDGGVSAGTLQGIAELQRGVQDATLAVPVALLDCGNGTMNNHMRKALKAAQHPAVAYAHRSHQVAVQETGQATVRMEGDLTIAGQTRPVSLEATAVERPDGSIRVQGSKSLKITEFGIRPPTLMLGTLKVHDPVTVHFDLLLRP